MFLKKLAHPWMLAFIVALTFGAAAFASAVKEAHPATPTANAEVQPLELDFLAPEAVATAKAGGEAGSFQPAPVGCEIDLADSGPGANCSCSATGAGATCVDNGEGGNDKTVTCTDATGAITCAYSANGSSCSCR